MYDLVGKTLGKYRIIEVIDQTVGTEVYKGFNPSINRYVVVNVLKAEFVANDAVLKRFLDQNDIAAKIHHPHLAPFYDFGQENGFYYRVYLFGVNGRLQENKQWFNSTEAILGLLSDLCSAVDYIHQFGYVHLNVSPANIYLDERNKPLLGDFGIVKSTDVSTANVYNSPEVRNNQPIDPRSDIYSLGVLVYELLTGSPPDLHRIVSLRTLRPDLPADVEKVVLRALSEKPEDRFQSVETFQSALEAAFRVTTVTNPNAAQAVPVVAAPVKTKINGWAIALITLLILVIVGAVIYFTVLQDDETQIAETPGDSAQPTAVPEQPTQAPAVPEQPTQPPVATDVPVEPTDRPGIQWPDFEDLPDLPICDAVEIPVAMAMVGVIMSKAVKKKR